MTNLRLAARRLRISLMAQCAANRTAPRASGRNGFSDASITRGSQTQMPGNSVWRIVHVTHAGNGAKRWTRF